jgi:hypothetical protein
VAHPVGPKLDTDQTAPAFVSVMNCTSVLGAIAAPSLVMKVMVMKYDRWAVVAVSTGAPESRCNTALAVVLAPCAFHVAHSAPGEAGRANARSPDAYDAVKTGVARSSASVGSVSLVVSIVQMAWAAQLPTAVGSLRFRFAREAVTDRAIAVVPAVVVDGEDAAGVEGVTAVVVEVEVVSVAFVGGTATRLDPAPQAAVTSKATTRVDSAIIMRAVAV